MTSAILTAYLADHWHPGHLGLVLGPNTKNAGFTSIQVAGTREQFASAIAKLKAEREATKGGEKASYTRCIQNLERAL